MHRLNHSTRANHDDDAWSASHKHRSLAERVDRLPRPHDPKQGTARQAHDPAENTPVLVRFQRGCVYYRGDNKWLQITKDLKLRLRPTAPEPPEPAQPDHRRPLNNPHRSAPDHAQEINPPLRQNRLRP